MNFFLIEYILNCNLFLWWQIIKQPLLQSKKSHDPSEIIICWFCFQETFLIIIDVENSCAA